MVYSGPLSRRTITTYPTYPVNAEFTKFYSPVKAFTAFAQSLFTVMSPVMDSDFVIGAPQYSTSAKNKWGDTTSIR